MKKKTATTKTKTSPVTDKAQNTLTVLFMTLIIAIVSGIIFVRGYYLDGTLLLAIGIALLSSLVDLQKISPIMKYLVYAMTVIPALLLVILIFRDFT